MSEKGLGFSEFSKEQHLGWKVPAESVVYSEAGIRKALLDLDAPLYVVRDNNRIGISSTLQRDPNQEGPAPLSFTPALSTDQLGDPEFLKAHGVKFPYYGGAMANGIASVEMVVALGKKGFMGSFGSGGLPSSRVEEAIIRIQKELPNGPYAFNLIHSPGEPALERANVDLYLKYGVHCVEAAAFMALTPAVVYYRLAGLGLDSSGNIEIRNRVIAKISRRETATRFMEPAPKRIVAKLLEENLITELQAELSQRVPMADDITAEADSGGHTDNRPLVAVLPAILSLRDEIQAKYNYEKPLRVGAGGGIGTPSAALATFTMGAAFVVTGSINQACVESGASAHTKKLLGQADMADVIMAPAADMFEMGVKLQVLKRGTLFAMRAQKLYNIYMNCNSIEEIPAEEREKLEKQIFRQSLDSIWQGTVDFFEKRDPAQIERAKKDPKKKMALIFRWYLGLASRWSNTGEPGREMDYQIWAGPSMGAFNAWAKGTRFSDVKNRFVAELADHIITGAAFLSRVQSLKIQGVLFPPSLTDYKPE